MMCLKFCGECVGRQRDKNGIIQLFHVGL
jgi:hypothetical protein